MMSHPQWQAADSVGVQGFDQAHREMIDLADRLILAVQAKGGRASPRDLLDDLVECAVAHFEEEERTLRELDWPGLPTHERAHDFLLRTLLKFKSELRYGRLTPEETASFISDWVLAHIRDEDMKYRDYLMARGVR